MNNDKKAIAPLTVELHVEKNIILCFIGETELLCLGVFALSVCPLYRKFK